MSTKFYPITVTHIEKTTAECVLVSFGIEEAIRPRFQFRQGQHLTLKAIIGGEEVRRSYSLCTSPLEGEWMVAIKKVPGGKFSTFANEVLQVGDTLEAMPPHGQFYVETDLSRQKNYLAFAAGSGITPILSIIKTHLATEPKASFRLLYVNQAVSTIILKEEIEALKNLYLDRFEVYHFLTKEEREAPLFNGRIDQKKLDILFSVLLDAATIDEYFICGPAEMIFTIKDFLTGIGTDAKQIHFELFNAEGLTKSADRIQQKAKEHQGLMSAIKVMEGGKSFTFHIPRASDTILDAALKKDADLPFACKGGVCCTCKAKLIEGEVEMNVNYALEQEQLDQGFILTCQAIPLTESITVDYDV